MMGYTTALGAQRTFVGGQRRDAEVGVAERRVGVGAAVGQYGRPEITVFAPAKSVDQTGFVEVNLGEYHPHIAARAGENHAVRTDHAAAP